MAAPRPFPLESLMRHPALMASSQAAYHITLTLCCLYWLNGCRPLPPQRSDRVILARTSHSTYSRCADEAESILAELLPFLDDLRDKYDKRAAALIRWRSAQKPYVPVANRAPRRNGKRMAGGISDAEQAAHAALWRQGVNLRRRITAAELVEGRLEDGTVFRDGASARAASGVSERMTPERVDGIATSPPSVPEANVSRETTSRPQNNQRSILGLPVRPSKPQPPLSDSKRR